MDSSRPDRRPRWRRPTQGIGASPPDILYHATTGHRIERFRRAGMLDGGPGKQVFLSTSEEEAWKVARRFTDRPSVLFVDAGRAQKEGLHFHRTRTGLFVTGRIPLRHVLNLRDGFEEQVSAGGFLVREDRGKVEVALICCHRRSGSTWEIAKGKLEAGETPPQAAVREVQEEMGFTGQLEVVHELGRVRYGFLTPEGQPRLKSLHVYVLRAEVAPERFEPARAEGIHEVRWVSLEDASRMVTHTSLREVVGQLLGLLGPPA